MTNEQEEACKASFIAVDADRVDACVLAHHCSAHSVNVAGQMFADRVFQNGVGEDVCDSSLGAGACPVEEAFLIEAAGNRIT